MFLHQHNLFKSKSTLVSLPAASPVLDGNARCVIENCGGTVTLRPLPGGVCQLNGREIAEPCRLAQGQFSTQILQLLSNTVVFLIFDHFNSTKKYSNMFINLQCFKFKVSHYAFLDSEHFHYVISDIMYVSRFWGNQ